jgi:predicted RNase H-like HicB family nuclease
MKDLEYYLGLPYTVEVSYDPSYGYFAKVLELPGCMTGADSPEEVWPAVEEALRDWIGTGLEHGDSIPEPNPESRTSHVLRMHWMHPYAAEGVARLLRAATT